MIVDDTTEFLEAASLLLEREGLAIVGLASTTAEAVRRTEELRPDLTLVDVQLGRENGFELAPAGPGRPAARDHHDLDARGRRLQRAARGRSHGRVRVQVRALREAIRAVLAERGDRLASSL
jgi:DNA-binding NarL/FixJ family response regulator